MVKRKAGFTLIEVLVIVFILGIVVIVGGNLFFSILKGASKAEVTKEVKQNGDYALGVMERMIRNAQEVVTNSDGQVCAITMSKFKIKNLDGGETEFSFAGTQIASNAAYLTSNKLNLSNASFSCQSSTVPPVITVAFTLSQAGADLRAEEKAQVSFQTTVSLRTYK